MIEKLKKIMHPPINPVDSKSQQGWEEVEKQINVILPDDYKEFISTYGIGRIGDFLWVCNPFSKNANLIDDMKYFQDAYTELKKDFPIDYPRPLFPKDNSLLLWGMTDNGDFLYWIYEKNKNSNNWKVGITDMGDDEYTFNMNMSTFLVRIIKNEIQTKVFPEDWLQMKNKTFMESI